MELESIEIFVPKGMKTFLLNENSSDKLRRNANRHISEKLFEQLLDRISHKG